MNKENKLPHVPDYAKPNKSSGYGTLENGFKKAVKQGQSPSPPEPVKEERPEITDYFTKGTLTDAHKAYINNPEMWSYIQALDRYIDSLIDPIKEIDKMIRETNIDYEQMRIEDMPRELIIEALEELKTKLK